MDRSLNSLPTLMTHIVSRLILAVVGIVTALLIVYGLITLFPDLLPQRFRDPLESRIPNHTVEVRYTDLRGDLFYHLNGQIKPPEENHLYSVHTVETDENGFRVPAQTRRRYGDYRVIALGDSFTDAWMVSKPWTDVLARQYGTPVLNLGYRGYGTLEEVEIMREFGQAKKGKRDWVLLAFFEGNDLQNIGTSYRDDNVLLNLVRDSLEPLEDFEIIETEDGNYNYPLALFIGDDYYEMAFYDYYIWGLNGEADTYRDSRNLQLFKGALDDIIDMAGDACVGVVYIPDKAHIYFPFAEPNGRHWILDIASPVRLDDDGWLDGGEQEPIEFETLLDRLDNMRNVVQETVAETDAHFIDLTPVFEDAALNSPLLYYPYDTHWSQAGHDLAGATIADYLASVDDC